MPSYLLSSQINFSGMSTDFFFSFHNFRAARVCLFLSLQHPSHSSFMIFTIFPFYLTPSLPFESPHVMFLFHFIPEPLNANVRESFFASSVLECAHLCRAEETCEAFKHRHISDDINCQVTEGEPKNSTTPEVDENNEKWTMYTMIKLGMV